MLEESKWMKQTKVLNALSEYVKSFESSLDLGIGSYNLCS